MTDLLSPATQKILETRAMQSINDAKLQTQQKTSSQVQQPLANDKFEKNNKSENIVSSIGAGVGAAAGGYGIYKTNKTFKPVKEVIEGVKQNGAPFMEACDDTYRLINSLGKVNIDKNALFNEENLEKIIPHIRKFVETTGKTFAPENYDELVDFILDFEIVQNASKEAMENLNKENIAQLLPYLQQFAETSGRTLAPESADAFIEYVKNYGVVKSTVKEAMDNISPEALKTLLPHLQEFVETSGRTLAPENADAFIEYLKNSGILTDSVDEIRKNLNHEKLETLFAQLQEFAETTGREIAPKNYDALVEHVKKSGILKATVQEAKENFNPETLKTLLPYLQEFAQTTGKTLAPGNYDDFVEYISQRGLVEKFIKEVNETIAKGVSDKYGISLDPAVVSLSKSVGDKHVFALDELVEEATDSVVNLKEFDDVFKMNKPLKLQLEFVFEKLSPMIKEFSEITGKTLIPENYDDFVQHVKDSGVLKAFYEEAKGNLTSENIKTLVPEFGHLLSASASEVDPELKTIVEQAKGVQSKIDNLEGNLTGLKKTFAPVFDKVKSAFNNGFKNGSDISLKQTFENTCDSALKTLGKYQKLAIGACAMLIPAGFGIANIISKIATHFSANSSQKK